jgi:hypothetical protein
MVFTLPPALPDNINEKIPERDLIQTNEIREEKEEDPLEVFRFKTVFNLPLTIIIQNIANAILLVLDDLFEPENYKSPKTFLKIFLIENRLIYLGLFVILLAMFLALFFPTQFTS